SLAHPRPHPLPRADPGECAGARLPASGRRPGALQAAARRRGLHRLLVPGGTPCALHRGPDLPPAHLGLAPPHLRPAHPPPNLVPRPGSRPVTSAHFPAPTPAPPHA